jgi:hypothetical protein
MVESPVTRPAQAEGYTARLAGCYNYRDRMLSAAIVEVKSVLARSRPNRITVSLVEVSRRHAPPENLHFAKFVA